MPEHFSDHSWPRVVSGESGHLHLPGGSKVEHKQLLRCTSDRLRVNPLLPHTENYSFSRSARFPQTLKNGETDHAEAQRREPPGPGHHFKTMPMGPAFSMDGGESVILGPNHVCPWKRPLGHHINPVFSDLTTLDAAPAFSFSKTRRAVSESSLGVHSGQAGGPVKTDLGCLSPGLVYEHFGTMQPPLPAPDLRPIVLSMSRLHDDRQGDDWRFATQSEPLKHSVAAVHVSVRDFTDQAQAKLRLALYDVRGRFVTDLNLFHSYGTYESSPSRTLKADEPVVHRAQAGYIYTLEYCVGSGGNSLSVQDWQCKVVHERMRSKPHHQTQSQSRAVGTTKAVRCVPVEPEIPPDTVA